MLPQNALKPDCMKNMRILMHLDLANIHFMRNTMLKIFCFFILHNVSCCCLFDMYFLFFVCYYFLRIYFMNEIVLYDSMLLFYHLYFTNNFHFSNMFLTLLWLTQISSIKIYFSNFLRCVSWLNILLQMLFFAVYWSRWLSQWIYSYDS